MPEAKSGFHHDSRRNGLQNYAWYRPTAGWAQTTYTGSSYWEVCEAKCRFDHCLP